MLFIILLFIIPGLLTAVLIGLSILAFIGFITEMIIDISDGIMTMSVKMRKWKNIVGKMLKNGLI